MVGMYITSIDTISKGNTKVEVSDIEISCGNQAKVIPGTAFKEPQRKDWCAYSQRRLERGEGSVTLLLHDGRRQMASRMGQLA